MKPAVHSSQNLQDIFHISLVTIIKTRSIHNAECNNWSIWRCWNDLAVFNRPFPLFSEQVQLFIWQFYILAGLEWIHKPVVRETDFGFPNATFFGAGCI